MIIVRLLSPEPFWLVQHHQVYSGLGADIVMESISPVIGKPSVVWEPFSLLNSFLFLKRARKKQNLGFN